MLRGWSKNLEGDSNIESHILTCLSPASFGLSSAEGDKSITPPSGSKQRVSAKTKEMVYYNSPPKNVIFWQNMALLGKGELIFKIKSSYIFKVGNG